MPRCDVVLYICIYLYGTSRIRDNRFREILKFDWKTCSRNYSVPIAVEKRNGRLIYLRCFFRPHGYFPPLNARLPFKYLQTLARMSFTEYIHAICTYFPKVNVYDLPRFSEFFTRFRRAYRNYQNRGKYRDKEAFHIYIYFWRIDRGDAQRNFDAWQKERIGSAYTRTCGSSVCAYCCTPTNLTWIGDRSLRPFAVNRIAHAAALPPRCTLRAEFNLELGNQTSTFLAPLALAIHSDNSKSL